MQSFLSFIFIVLIEEWSHFFRKRINHLIQHHSRNGVTEMSIKFFETQLKFCQNLNEKRWKISGNWKFLQDQLWFEGAEHTDKNSECRQSLGGDLNQKCIDWDNSPHGIFNNMIQLIYFFVLYFEHYRDTIVMGVEVWRKLYANWISLSMITLAGGERCCRHTWIRLFFYQSHRCIYLRRHLKD